VAHATGDRLRAALAAAQEIGAIGPGSLDDHIAHAGAFVEAIKSVDPEAQSRRWRVLDLGTGGGLPGLIVAELVESWNLTLLDGRTERIRLLEDAVGELGWRNRVESVAERAEVAAHDPARRGAYDAIVVRSFAAPAVTAECAAGFLRLGGLLVVSEPPGAGASRWPSDGCAQLGLELAAVVELPRSFVVLRSTEPCPDRYPRRTGIPSKRPLFVENRP
jgi:16S rRNA (guanine527-N7)-methyltransferase